MTTFKTLPTRAKKLFVLFAVGEVLLVLGITCLTVAVVWTPGEHDKTGHIAHEFFVALWPFFLTVAAAIIVYERWLRDTFLTELKRIAGPQVIQALPPRESLRALLDHVYGNKRDPRDVISGVLGGYGAKADRTDLTISDDTTVGITLKDTEKPEFYDLTFAVSYKFGSVGIKKSEFVFFVTSSAQLRDLVVSGCDHPLFDLWYVPDGGSPLDVSKLTKSVSLVVAYDYNDDGKPDSTAFQRNSRVFSGDDIELEPIPCDKWDGFLRFFREDVGSMRKLDPNDYESSLVILKFSFRSLLEAESDHWSCVRGITITSTTTQKKSDGNCYWTATYPCFVTSIGFDASGLTPLRDAGSGLEFRSAPFLLRAETESEIDQWSPTPIGLKPDSWLLPGHGVSLMWRTAEPDDPVAAAQPPE